ncbi:hypothetical protein [Cellulomonas shaoxiangyii]|uniref:hypothetical protein n=1 Tax=Cellulomonas shaoxiangyii TaxID=2566013 RepID=UPI00140E5B20|nr:hypothetical protein [Cellulomonas shaoxiangyii]
MRHARAARAAGRGDDGEFLGRRSFYRRFAVTSSQWLGPQPEEGAPAHPSRS